MANGESLTRAAYQRVRADLLACRLKPGARISISELAADLEVSAGAVREALARLTAEGLVVAEPLRGFRAVEVSASDLRDLTAVRVQIEQLCVRSSIARGDVSWESRLVAAHHALSRAPEREPHDERRLGDTWSDTHHAFHEALASACDSRYLLEIRATLYARSERYRRLSVPLSSARRNIGGEHRGLVAAALARDGDRVAALLAAHLQKTSAILIDALFTNAPETDKADDGKGRAAAARRARIYAA